MGFIARNLRHPSRSFLYNPVELKGDDELIIEVLNGKGKSSVELGTPYEFLLNFQGKANKVIGIPVKKLLNKVYVKITAHEEGSHRFPKLDVSSLNIPVDVIPKPKVILKGQCLDFSLGGTHVRLSPEDYQRAKEYFKENPVWDLVFHCDRESYQIYAAPSNFHDRERVVLFLFSYTPDNYVILDLYEKLLRKVERKFLH